VTFYLADTIFHHDVNVVESHKNWYNSHHDEKFHFLLHWAWHLSVENTTRYTYFYGSCCTLQNKKPLGQPTVPSAYEPSSCATKHAVSFRGVVRIVRRSPQCPGSTFCKLCGKITAVGSIHSFLSLSPLTNYCTTATATNYRHLLLLLTTQKRMRGARE
jgi:hypothetical protein